MWWCQLVLINFVLQFVVAKNLHPLKRDLEEVENRPRLAGSSPNGGPIFQYLTLLYNQAQLKAIGTGVAWNQHWMATTQFAVAGYETDQTNLYVYTGVTDLNNLLAAPAVKRKARQVIVYDAAAITGSLHALAIVRVCTGFLPSQFVSLITSAPVVGEVVQLITYDNTNVVTASKQFGDSSECSSLPNWNSNYDICLANDFIWYAQTSDLPGIVVSYNGFVAGFITAIQNDPNGEIVLDLSKYTSWINQKAI